MRRVPVEEHWPESWKLSHHYDELELHGAAPKSGYAYTYAERWRQTMRLVARAAKPPAHVIDIAAAQGNFTLALAHQGYEVTWNDIREELEGYVRLKHSTGAVHFEPGNVFDLAHREHFDVALITEVIEHTAHPDQFLQQTADLVVPGGHIVMSTPNGGYVRNTLPRFTDHPDPSVFESQQFAPNADGHIFLLHADEIATLGRAAGLELIEHCVFANTVTNGHVGLGALLRVLPGGVVRGLEAWTQARPSLARWHANSATLFRKPAR